MGGREYFPSVIVILLGGYSSGGRAGCPVIGGSLVQIPCSYGCTLKYPYPSILGQYL